MLENTLIVSEIEKRLGAAVRQYRLDAGYTQAELAERASISRSAVQNLESGSGSQLANLLKVLRALGKIDALSDLSPRTEPTPMELLAAQKQMQRRKGKQQRVRKAL